MSKHIYLAIFTAFLIFSSCGTKEPKHELEKIPEENPVSKDTIYVSDVYPEINSEVKRIMDSLQFCELIVDKSLPDSLQMYPCSSEYFGIFNNTNSSWENGFIMEAAQGVWARSSRVFNIEKVEDVYLVTNDMKGQLLMLLPKENGKHDLVIRYYDSQVGTVSILHQWKGKNYKPVEVMMINDYPIKKEFQDSLNNVYLSNFIWGY